MEKNIFEGAKFGDKFLTRNNKKALFIESGNDSHNNLAAILRVEGELNDHIYDIDGHCRLYQSEEFDIVSKHQEPIDENKLNIIANEFADKVSIPFSRRSDINSFKAGYRKAMEK